MSLTEKDRQIGTQVAAKIAAELVVLSYKNDDQPDVEEMVGSFISTLDMVNDALLNKMGEDNLNASGMVADVIPIDQKRQESMAKHPSNQPADIPGAADGDPQVAAWWRDYFNNPGGWYDNRGRKKNPKGPDFSSKTLLQPGSDYKAGLWVNDKKNPSWVANKLDGSF